jgi:hypothetical protein
MDVPEKPWQANGSVEQCAELDQNPARYGERPWVEDRRQEAGRRHAPARKSGLLAKQMRKGMRSESEQASSFRLK